MKNLFITLTLIGAFSFSGLGAFAAWQDMQPNNQMPYISYSNPISCGDIEENKASFSLNPFTGFKNCNKCKIKKVKCDECTRVTLNTCPTCVKAFSETCDSCNEIYIQPVQPKCSCGINH